MKIDIKGFRDFILRGNVVDLAVAVVIGMAFNAIVKAFVTDIVTPLIGLIFGGASFADKLFKVRGQRFLYGDLIDNILYFVIVAAVIFFFVVQPVGALMAKFNPPVPEEPPATKECVECLSTIPAEASRCAFCTVEQ
jgi:large conductance mechanosensitive channel